MSNEGRGRLELCDNQVWFSVLYSYSDWERWNTRLACQAVGYDGSGIHYSLYEVNYYNISYHVCLCQNLLHIEYIFWTNPTYPCIHWPLVVPQTVYHLVLMSALVATMWRSIQNMHFMKLGLSVEDQKVCNHYCNVIFICNNNNLL